MLFEKGAKLYSYEVRRESGENVAYINYLGAPFLPSIANSPETMARVMDVLIESPNVSRVVLVQQRNYNYDLQEITMLAELGNLYNFLIKQESILSPNKLGNNQRDVARRYGFMNLFVSLLKSDPIAAYYKLKEEASANSSIKKTSDGDVLYQYLLTKTLNLLENTKLIQEFLNLEQEYNFGDRKIYSELFSPNIIPNYAFARLVSNLPLKGKIVSQYEIGTDLDKSTVSILKIPNELKYA